MNAVVDSKENVVLRLLQKSLLRYGRSLALPKNTDVTKTYGWRFLESFVKRLDDLNIDCRYYGVIINALVDYAKKHKLLNRGFAILSKSDLLELSVSALQNDIKNKRNKMTSIAKAHQFLDKESGGKLHETLSKRIRVGSYTNLTRWYEQGHINNEYIALSKSCVLTMRKLDKNERDMLPHPIDLLKLKYKLFADKDLIDKIVALMGDDFNPLVQ